jgi:hypothetical protein
MDIKILSNWSKKLNALPVWKDLPRLLKGISITDRDGNLIFRERSEENRVSNIYKFLILLSEQLNETNVTQIIEQQYPRYVTDSGSIQTQLQTFFDNCGIPENSKLYKILKCIQQEIIVAPVMELRTRLYEKFPYKDEPGSWRVEIEFRPNSVRLVHRKRERSYETTPENFFGFEWILELNFTRKLSNFDVKVSITDWWFHKQASQARKQKLEEAFRSFSSPEVPFLRTWKRPLKTIGLPTDLPRIIETLHITKNNEFIYVFDSNDRERSLLNFFLTLAREFDTEEEVKKITQAWNEIPSTSSLVEKVQRLFQRPEMDDNWGVWKVVRSMQQELKLRGLLTMMNALHNRFSIRDIKDSWKLSIDIQQLPSWNMRRNRPNKDAVIIHYGQAESREPTPQEPHFIIEFQVILKLTYGLNHFHSELQVIDWRWTDRIVSAEVKDALESLLSQWIPREVHFKRIWNRDIGALTVHHYLPKIISQMQFWVGNRTVFSGNSVESSPSGVYEFLVLLAQHLDCPTIAKLLKANFAYLVKTSGDLGEKLKSLFVTFEKNSKFVKVLKLIHIDILLPALLKLRQKIYTKFPFKEVKGDWSVIVKVTGNNDIVVLHKKKEQSHDTNPQSYFEFLWELEFFFNKDLSDFTVNFAITDWNFTTLVSPEIKHQFEEVIREFVPKNIPYKRLWKKPLQTFDIGYNLSRMYLRVEIYDMNGVLLYKEDNSKSAIEQMRELVYRLALYLENETIANQILVEFSNYVSGKKDNATAIEDFFLRGGAEKCGIKEESPLIKLLKCLTKEIIAPAVTDIKSNFYQKFPFKDVKGSWFTIIFLPFSSEQKKPLNNSSSIQPETSNTNKVTAAHVSFTDFQEHLRKPQQGIRVLHRKKEETYPNMDGDQTSDAYFIFEWQLIIDLTPHLDDFAVDFNIINMSFHEDMVLEKRMAVQRAFGKLVKDDSKVYQRAMISLSVPEVVELAIDALKSNPNASAPLVKHPQLHNVSVVELLEALQRAVSNTPVTLPKVLVPEH